MKATFNVMDLIRCPYDTLPREKPDTYIILPKPLKGTLFVSFDNPGYMSGQIRVRGNGDGKYPFHYLEMIENTIEVCSGSVAEKCVTVDQKSRNKSSNS